MSEKKIQLSLKTEWFEMTKAGIKTEDYREITPYWAVRLMYGITSDCDDRYDLCERLKDPTSITRWNLEKGFLKFKQFTHNVMTLGYPKKGDSDRIIEFEHAGIEIRTGNPEWGAEPGKLYFVIKHGKRL